MAEAADTQFLIEVLLGVLFGIAMWSWTYIEHKQVTSRELRVAYFTTPAGHVLSIIGVLVPVLAGLFSFLASKQPQKSYSSLLASITFLFVVLVVAIWVPFALLKKASGDEKITLNFPADRRYITAMGLMYAFTVLGLFYLALFLVFEMPSAAREQPGTAVLLQKPSIKIGQAREDIERVWGAPVIQGSVAYYATDTGTLRLMFTTDGKLAAIEELKGEAK